MVLFVMIIVTDGGGCDDIVIDDGGCDYNSDR